MQIELFEGGYQPHDYVNGLRNYRSLVKQLTDEVTVDPTAVAALKTLAAKQPQPVRATIMTEDWCGDAACNLPQVALLLESAGIELRVIRGSEQPALKERYESEGDDHIPVLSLWDATFREIGRWIEAPKAVAAKKAAWKAEHSNFEDLYARQKSGDKEAAKQFASLYRELLEEMAGWYKGGLWSETVREIIELLQ